ncbi:SGNH/GDSL hydrolase family protein [Corallococcus sp. H22C18031201]|nr:SGNH/GDSL hydrolase family protein [Corallococcus sp. H22C18031201]
MAWSDRLLGVMGTLGLLAACGLGGDTSRTESLSSRTAQDAAQAPLEPTPVLDLRDDRHTTPRPPPAAKPTFQPGFHQALRGSISTDGLTTFRLRLRLGRAGDRVRITFRAGDGGLTLQRATIAQAGDDSGALASTPVPIAFHGTAGFTTEARTLVTSDPVAFPVTLSDEVIISFEAQGNVAASIIDAFPGSFSRAGAFAMTQGPIGGAPWEKAVGVATVDVEGPPGRAFVAVGDSITEGYMSSHSDTRKAWPSLVEEQLGIPVVNSGVSGEGFWDAQLNLQQEVLSLEGVTDCIVLLGTNDLSSGLSVGELEDRMTRLLDSLEPFCRLWVGTLLPKEKTHYGDYGQVKAQRHALNAWIRQLTRATVIDLEAVMRQPSNPDLFLPGLSVDGIHPSEQGHQVMAAEVVRVLRAKGGL